MGQRLVVKFGGTSVGSASAISQAADIVCALHGDDHQVAVVVSAMSGVTDALLSGAAAAVSRQRDTIREIAARIDSKHATAATELALPVDEQRMGMSAIRSRLGGVWVLW